ncbi:DUF2867 domain-containing protein [Streptomyces sp. SID13031]|uniref:DUF2867 domain-containing protein n=1 Tax=Streptomyces sp. SID13031 TaxID=2706046 RepID=UPI0013C603FB|nr:DUF2867 domain-containing protein [Streptomyces sp. SID13031]NEA35868.1 DUF2867 domain-containing protein [Streptomyces sp. SID13031]
MRLPLTAHTAKPWRIHELTPDFTVEDVWALPTPGGPGEFPRLLAQFSGSGFPAGAPGIVRVLWEARWKLGRVFGWDDEDGGLGARVPTLRDRFPDDLRTAPTGPDLGELPFDPLYQLDDEWAAEMANRTVHGVLHLSWVPDGTGGYRGQMAVLVKPNGRRGAAYMAAIKPFRYLFVYPALLRLIERKWQESELEEA